MLLLIVLSLDVTPSDAHGEFVVMTRFEADVVSGLFGVVADGTLDVIWSPVIDLLRDDGFEVAVNFPGVELVVAIDDGALGFDVFSKPFGVVNCFGFKPVLVVGAYAL